MNRLEVELLGKKLKNPIIPASGTFGFGYEFAEYYDINILGSIALKGTTLHPRYGNPLPRVAECKSGMINAIGLQNPGADQVISTELVKLKKAYRDKAIINIGGHSFNDYIDTAKKFNGISNIWAVELNISCPNVEGGGMAFGTNPLIIKELTSAVKRVITNPLIVKLSPNVTSIQDMAIAAEEGGADAISLINTLVGMRIDLKTGKPIISVKSGGYSGVGVFPIAIRMIYAVSSCVKIPVIGMGGISNAREVLEAMYAGAHAVMIGTQNLIDPYACQSIINELPDVMDQLSIRNIRDIIRRSI
ncbi:MAG: dihydroorotate dehydrogenase [Christensenellaceae bacterium]|jgi:dihydroorotate dehydrogenase (NAD+) catalytic subunit|nr:dihydroorotate dehydrogenase [Christensenellaceae bacterium]